MKLLEENRGANIHSLGFGSGFLNMTPIAQTTKQNR